MKVLASVLVSLLVAVVQVVPGGPIDLANEASRIPGHDVGNG